MNDERLKSLYRRLTRDSGHDAFDPERLVEPLSRSGYPEAEGTPLDRIAASATQSDLLRVLIALEPETQALARDVARLRASPRRAVPAARTWWAMAAGAGAVAVLVAGLRTAPESTPVLSDSSESQAIFSVSFEGVPQRPVRQHEGADSAPIFGADFDS
jgi:hypothetical protein